MTQEPNKFKDFRAKIASREVLLAAVSIKYLRPERLAYFLTCSILDFVACTKASVSVGISLLNTCSGMLGSHITLFLAVLFVSSAVRFLLFRISIFLGLNIKLTSSSKAYSTI